MKTRFLAALFAVACVPFSAQAMFAPGTPIASDPFVLGPTDPGKWGSPVMGTGAAVTYSYMATGTSCAGECPSDPSGSFTSFADFMPVGYETTVRAAFDLWEAVADITFTEVADTGEAFNAPGGSGDIRIGGHLFDGPGGILAHGYYPPINGDTAAGDIHFDTGDTWSLDGIGGFNLLIVMAHEIGHAIGLDHTGIPDSLMNPFYNPLIDSPQADDIAGAVFIYGEPAEEPPNGVPAPASILLLVAGIALIGRMRARS